MKRIVSMQDLSCVGKCSLSIALPVLAAMGIECACLPTQLLSAHTVFEGFYSRDLSDSFAPITRHWDETGLEFDGIYTGFLGSTAQVEAARGLVEKFRREGKLCFVDPVMADQGALYHGIDPALPEAMAALCKSARIITPNITEACLLTGTDYRSSHDTAYIHHLLEGLLRLGVETAIVTGIHTDSAHMGVAAMGQNTEPVFHFTHHIPGLFHGAGDLFAATCVGALLLGYSAADSIRLAADYVFSTIRTTAADPDARWYGVNFEQTLPELLARLGKVIRKEEEG